MLALLLCLIFVIFVTIYWHLYYKQNQYIKIAYHQKSIIPSNCVTLGVAVSSNENVYLTDKELNQHTLVIGTTGSGKTTTLLNFVNSCYQRSLPLVYIDGKGDLDLIQNFIVFSQKYNRRLKIFSLDFINHDFIKPYISPYNPLSYGDFTQWKNKIITLTQEAQGKGQEHYSLQEQLYINLVCEILYKSQSAIDLEGVIAYLKNKKQLLKLANDIDNNLAVRLLEVIKEDNDIIRILENFYYSSYGSLFSTSNTNPNDIISLPQALHNKEIILFSLNSASYKKDTNLLGKLIINDINNCWSYFAKNHGLTLGYCIFDEFGAYTSPNMATILSQQRANGLHAIVATQSINAISLENITIRRVAVELIANCNNFILHKINDPVDIDLIASLVGDRVSDEYRYNYDVDGVKTQLNNIIANTKQNYILNLQDIRQLQSGYGYLYQPNRYYPPQKVKFISNHK